MHPSAVVLFDVDGVLLDSLDAHLRFCRDKGAEYRLATSIPSVSEMKALVRRGVPISPMRNFLLAVGFSPADADRADADYKREFGRRYAPRPFPGIDALLSRLAAARLPLGVATSNTIANVSGALGPSMRFFDARCVFDRDSSSAGSKARALVAAASLLGVGTERVWYVGDQPEDRRAAHEVGARFLAVTYGWGFQAGDVAPQATRPDEIGDVILGR